MEKPHQKDERQRFYALLALGKKALRLDDETYRAMLARHGAKEREGRTSASTMSLPELFAAVEDMKAKGFVPHRKDTARVSDWRAARVAKLRAMWIALADAGVVRDRGDHALAKFCARVTGNARMEWLNSKQLSDCVQALRTWAGREGVLKE